MTTRGARILLDALLAAVALAGCVCAGVTAASAADLPGSIKDYGAAPGVSNFSPARWYLRGDIGWAGHDKPSIAEHGPATDYDLTQTRMDRAWTYGAGVGAYLGANTRADITIDWRRKTLVSGFLAEQYTYDPVTGDPDGLTNLPGTHRFNLQSTVGLLNFHYDFGNRSHFSPYVGAGIGVVRHATSGGTLIDDCNCGTSGTIAGKTRYDLAAALMAGVSVAVRSDIHLDAGYRFLYMGKAETGAMTGTTTALPYVGPASTGGPSVTDIHAHEWRVGVRYDLAGR